MVAGKKADPDAYSRTTQGKRAVRYAREKAGVERGKKFEEQSGESGLGPKRGAGRSTSEPPREGERGGKGGKDLTGAEVGGGLPRCDRWCG